MIYARVCELWKIKVFEVTTLNTITATINERSYRNQTQPSFHIEEVAAEKNRALSPDVIDSLVEACLKICLHAGNRVPI